MSSKNSFGQKKNDNKLKYKSTIPNIYYSNSSKSPSKYVNEVQKRNNNYLNRYSNIVQNSSKDGNKINYYRKITEKNEINKKLNAEYSFQDSQRDNNYRTYTLKNTTERRMNEKYENNNKNDKSIIIKKNRYNNNNNNNNKFKERKVTTYKELI